MSLCINPSCSNPQNLDTLLFCQACGSELLLAGHYRVMRLLSNKGGFGTTYEVSHKGQPKVLKVLINYQGKAVELFEQEARVLQQLNHPGIPKGESYFTFCPRNSQMPLHCLVMEKIEGLDLQEYLKKRGNRPIDQTLALEWLMQLAEILDEVHGQNFFHRDIKPSNIILRADGQLVLIDFGTVREITATYKLKQAAGGVTGIISLGYTPSEQLHHHAVPQSDFFSLGRTFVYLLTGKEPTDPDIYDCQNDELVWRSRASNISSELADFIDRLMMRSATHRPRNTGEILKRLAEIDRIVNPPPPPRRVPSQVSATVPIAPVNPVTPTSSPGTAGLLNRRRLLHMAGFGGVGVMVVGIIHQLQRHPFPWINNPAIKSTAPGQLTLSSFEFEVVTVDQKGKIATRNRRVAQYFTEE
ncbi:MAG TPA: protein kinase, partial [Cyanobacteria bacterium UBA8803]|nr:protein kinase [Cyanobacteria bacterium UBA8803]